MGRAGTMRLDERGQAALEYLLVGLVLVSMMGALGALWHFAADGGFSRIISLSASHGLGFLEGVLDVLSF